LKPPQKFNNHNGKVFVNLNNDEVSQRWLDILKWQLAKKNKAKWPKKVDNSPTKPLVDRVPTNQIHATFVNHATVLLQMDGLNIITDPVWAERASPFTWAGTKRVQSPGMRFDDVPKIDLILLSHNHYDHMDVEALEKFAERDQSTIVCGLNNRHYLKKQSQKNTHELDWNTVMEFKGLKITFLPARHWSKRTFTDTNKSLWGAFAVEGSQKVYFAGDTGYGEHFKMAQNSFDHFDLSLIPIGAYSPRWCFKHHHMDPFDAAQAHLDLNSKCSLGIHHSTFQLTDEAMNEPRELLEQAKKKMNIKDSCFVSLEHGGHLEVIKDLKNSAPQL